MSQLFRSIFNIRSRWLNNENAYLGNESLKFIQDQKK